jgi:anti-anti-sigma factor
MDAQDRQRFATTVGWTGFETVVLVEGAAETATEPELRRCLAEAVAVGVPTVVVELSACEALDEAHVGALVTAHAQLRRSGRRLVLANPGDAVTAVLAATSADRVLPVQVRPVLAGGGVPVSASGSSSGPGAARARRRRR